jgi:hypothetical protein
MREVLHLTTRTLERRAIGYRRIAVGTLVAMLLGPVYGVMVGAWWPLIGLLAPVPGAVLFLLLDRARVRAWVRGVRAYADEKGLPMSVIVSTLGRITYLPHATVRGMIAELERAERDSALRVSPTSER